MDFRGEFIEEKHGEILDEYLKEAHSKGIKVIIYFCLHELFESDKISHPEWIQKTKNDEFIGAYGSHYLACLNSSWAEYSLSRIKSLCKHDIDGIFLDGPLFAVNGCYCPVCKNKFENRYKKSYFEASLYEFLTFRMDCLTDFVKEIKQVVDSVKPEIVLYLNNSALRADITGSNTRRLWEFVDFIGAEGGFSSATTESKYLTGLMAKEIETKAEGKPTVIFTAGDRKPHSFAMHSAADTIRMLAQTIANGANIWYGLHGTTSQMESEGGRAATDFIRFVRENAEYLSGTHAVSNVAVVWSSETANFYSSKILTSDFTGEEMTLGNAKDKGDHFAEFIGWCEMLSRMHISFDVVDEEAFCKNYKKYETVIFPAVACMSDRFVEQTKSYLNYGGNVVASLIIGEFDEKGKASKDRKVGEIFGLEFDDNKWEWPGIVYCTYEGESKYCVCPTIYKRAKAVDCKVLSYRHATMTGRYEKPTEIEAPYITQKQYKNSSSFCFLGNIGQDYVDFTAMDYLDSLKRVLPIKPIIDTDAPSGVEITVREKNGRYLIHFINLTGDCGPMTEVPVVPEIKFNLPSEFGIVAKAFSLGKEQIIYDGKQFILKNLSNYACVVVEIE